MSTPMPRIKVTYSPEQEIEYVKFTLSQRRFLDENGYKYDLPQGLSDDPPEDEIRQAVESEYNAADYDPLKNLIDRQWPSVINQSGHDLKCLLPHISSDYFVRLTRYGPGGSYHPPHQVSVHLKRQRGDVDTILHEIVHLGVHALITQNQVGDWAKERVVDLLARAIRPTFEPQPLSNTSFVDGVFDCLYPNASAMILAIAKLDESEQPRRGQPT
jgi:hypothetical protein